MGELREMVAEVLRSIRSVGFGKTLAKILRALRRSASNVMVKRHPTVPRYVYSARVSDEDIPWFEQQFFEQAKMFGPEVRATPERFEYAKRMGYAFFGKLKASVADSSLHKAWKPEFVTLGKQGYQWTYVPSLLPADPVLYAFGVGTDISFEVELAHKHKSVVHCFDPTPQAIAYAEKIASEEPLIAFQAYGLFSSDTTIRFYKPPDVGLGSMSIHNLHHGDSYVDASVLRLGTIMKKLGHDHLDLMKIDIEGAEYDALEDMLSSRIRVDQLAVEFDQPVPPWRTEAMLQRLNAAGYRLVFIDGLNCLLVQEKLLAA